MAKKRKGKVRRPPSGPSGWWVEATLEPVCRSVLRSAMDLLDMDDPLDAELWASELVGMLSSLPLIGADPHDVIGESLVRKARHRRSPETLAFLLALAAVAPPRLADKAGAAARELQAAGLRAPAWAAEAGRAVAVEAWMAGDSFGAQDAVFIAFRHGTRPAHTFVALVDHNLGDIVKDVFVAGPPKVVLDDWNSRSNLDAEPVSVTYAAAMLTFGLEAREGWADPPSSRELVQVEALLAARLRGLVGAGTTRASAPAPASFNTRSESQRRALLTTR